MLLRGDAEAALEADRRSPLAVPFSVVGPPLAMDALGQRPEAEHAMEIAETRFGVDMACQIAYFCVRRGDTARAMDWLNRAYRQHDGGLARAKIDPMLRSLHAVPGFAALLKSMRLLP